MSKRDLARHPSLIKNNKKMYYVLYIKLHIFTPYGAKIFIVDPLFSLDKIVLIDPSSMVNLRFSNGEILAKNISMSIHQYISD